MYWGRCQSNFESHSAGQSRASAVLTIADRPSARRTIGRRRNLMLFIRDVDVNKSCWSGKNFPDLPHWCIPENLLKVDAFWDVKVNLWDVEMWLGKIFHIFRTDGRTGVRHQFDDVPVSFVKFADLSKWRRQYVNGRCVNIRWLTHPL